MLTFDVLSAQDTTGYEQEQGTIYASMEHIHCQHRENTRT